MAVVLGFKNGNDKQTVFVKRSNIIQEVAVTGKVKPNQSVDLGFNQSGRVGSVYVSVGDMVEKDKVLATLELSETLADLNKAKAALEEERIKLREIKNTSPITHNDAAKNLSAAIKESFADADNAIRNRTDQFFKTIPENPQFEISITSGNYVHYFNVPNDTKIEINISRKNVEEILSGWQKRIATLNSSNLVSEADKAIADLGIISSFLDKMASAINSFSSADYAYDTTVANYKATISSARGEVLGAISALVTAKDKFNLAPTLGSAGQFESVLVQESKVSQAMANVDSFVAFLEKSVIKAPFSGVVTLQEAKVGGAVSAGSALISIASENEMYIEANVSEIHIDKVAIGNTVSVSFDAFPEEQFLGEIYHIEPAEVIIDGVVNYRIKVNLKNYDQKVKSGLTSNLKIETNRKENVLTIPLYTVTKEGEQNFVNKMVDKRLQKTEISLGAYGTDGSVEVLNGLNEEDILAY